MHVVMYIFLPLFFSQAGKRYFQFILTYLIAQVCLHPTSLATPRNIQFPLMYNYSGHPTVKHMRCQALWR